MSRACTRSSSGVTFKVAGPKVIKKGDTVITSYVDEETGKISAYEPGIKLEVSHPKSGLWYPAKVKQVNLEEAEILIHYEKWSHRFDEWIKMDSSRLRPSANTNVVKVEFRLGEKVEAIWSKDGQRYPAVITQVYAQPDYYEVRFEDGIKCKKKSNQIFKTKQPRGRPRSVKTYGSSNNVPANVNVSPVLSDHSALPEQEQNVDTVLDSQSPLQTDSPPITPPVHFSIFTPPTGELGKRKRTIQDYSALLQRTKFARTAITKNPSTEVLDEEYSASPGSEKVKTRITRKSGNSHAAISDGTKKECTTFPTVKGTLGVDESEKHVCKGITRGRRVIPMRSQIPSDLANLEIPPPPESGYRLKKLYLEIDEVNEVNIEQVVRDPEGIIFKLNDPVPEGWEKEAQLKFRNESYPKWFISYISPTWGRFRYLKQMHELIQEANFDFTPFDFRPLNPKLQEIAKLVSGGQYSYKRRLNMPPPSLLSELETSPGIGVPAIAPKPIRPQSVKSVQVIQQQSLMSPSIPADSKIASGFVDAEGNDVNIEQGEDGGWACPAEGCDKHFRKDSLLQMHFKHYHPEMKIKSRGGVKIASVVEMATARTAFDYDEEEKIPEDKNTDTVKEVNKRVTSSSSFAASLRGRINSIQNNFFLKSIRRREKRKAAALQVKRPRIFVRKRRGGRVDRPRVTKPVDYFSGLPRKQMCRIRREVVDKGIPIRYVGYSKSTITKDIIVDLINCICNNNVDEFGLMIQCDLCFCWQHGSCFGFYEDEDLPKYYACESCRNLGNPSEKGFWEWQVQGYHKTGHLPSLCNTAIPNYHNSYVRAKCSKVKNWIFTTANRIENCSFKLWIAHKKPDHPKLFDWEHPTENPLQKKKTHDFRITYKPLFLRHSLYLDANNVDYKQRMRQSYLKHLHWKEFQTLVDDFKRGIRNQDAKFLIILNKLSVHQQWRVRNKMEEKRLLNLVDDETSYTNPFAIWARKRRQRQQWESKMKRHAGILEKEKCIEELLFKIELAKSSKTKVERSASKKTNNFDKSTVLNPPDRLKNGGSRNARENVFPTFSFCARCRTSAFKRWDWSDFAKNGDEFFEKNIQDKDTSSKKNANKVYLPSTLKSLCEMAVARLKLNKELPFSDSDKDAKSGAENLEASKETRSLVDGSNRSDTTESIDCEDCPGDEEIHVNLDEECIRCYLVSVSLSKDTNCQSDREKFSAVNYRDILTFLGLADSFRQGIWDSVENTAPNIPVSRRTGPIINRREGISSQRIILHYNSELRRYWKRMFNIRLKGLDLRMQKQTWVDELVRLYSEIHLLLVDMLKVVDETSEVDELGEVLLRKIDIFRSICGTPDFKPSDYLITNREIFSEVDDAKSFIPGVPKATDKSSSSKEDNYRPTETTARQNSKTPEKVTPSKSESKNHGHQSHHPSVKGDEEFVTPNTEAKKSDQFLNPLKQTLGPKTHGPFLTKSTAESCRENLLEHVSQQQQLLDSNLDKLEELVCELERKYLDPRTSKGWVQAIQMMTLYYDKLQFLKTNAESLCGGTERKAAVSDGESDADVEESSVGN